MNLNSPVTYEIRKLGENVQVLTDLAQQATEAQHTLVANSPYFSVSDMMEMARITHSIERMAKRAQGRLNDELELSA